MTRDEMADRIQKYPVVILPMGATEQHGYHMPLGVDIFLAEALSNRVAEKIGATVLPTLSFGYSYVWRNDAGTVSLQQHNLENIIKDVAHSVSRYGVKHLILINGHAANASSMKYAIRDLSDECDVQVWSVFYPDLQTIMGDVCDSEMWHNIIHACEFETSMMLAIKPELVQMHKACKEYPPYHIGYFHGSTPMGDLSKSGVFGDATLATAKKGEILLQKFTHNIIDLVQEIYPSTIPSSKNS